MPRSAPALNDERRIERMISRQPKIHFTFRIGAAVTVVFWLLASSYCGVEYLFGCGDHGAATTSDEHGHHDATAHDDHAHADVAEHGQAGEHHSHEATGHSQGSHHHDGEDDFCCSTVQAAVPNTQPIFISKPLVQQLSILSALLQPHTSALTALNKASDRPPPNHDWVFVPEVCTGPANRSHAPPAFV